ncbi:hypothetical protein EUX98_g96 [Antrodiella citrinella]|uniref:Vacuolar protein sorting-associated protein 13 n=1 Tax=Antrodiella citrinella TaxID=2447956 RepID=A0A4S4N4Y7_9APHY|nr:hypothetical protein EUX98_g96 [Antrodiella citrinella]
MWWLDPGKEVLNILFNRILAPYVMNLDMNQVNYGIGQGQLTLRSLQLKKGALDKFRLPVDVIEGHLGKFTLSLHWMNLGNQPVEILIEDVYLLVVPSSENGYDPEEEERRIQATKAERLENADLLHMRGQAEEAEGDKQQSQGLLSSLITKIVNNLQVTVKNIHIRYEDKLSVPGHPFSAGVTLAGFTAVSVNDSWIPAFIDSTAGAIHKLATLESLALYFDTDAPSLAGLPHPEFVEKFAALIAKGNKTPKHQFILQPVTGQGRIKMNRKQDKNTPQFDIQLLFEQIGVLLDDNQYRDAISLVDMYHFYSRQHQYRKYKPAIEDFEEDRPKALLRFATDAILDEVRQRKRKWTWAYFAERRDDRHLYIELFKKKEMGPLSVTDAPTLDSLEKKLSYEDLRFYRSIARSQLRKDMAFRKKQEEERRKQQAAAKPSGWSSWIWGSSGNEEPSPTEASFTGEMTDEQRQQLYEVLDFDEKTALTEAFQTPRDALKLRVNAKLDHGSFALKTDPHGKNKEITSVSFDGLQATFLQRPDNFETSLSLGGFAVRDGTVANSLYPLIVHAQDQPNQSSTDDPFFFLKFESNPLDERADTALAFRMRYMEIVYHRGYVEAIYRFFKPPASQLESVEALLSAASETLEGLRKETRAGLEYALQTHKTIDIQMDLNAPIIIIPEDITTNTCKHMVIDAGHIAVESQLANKKAIQEIHAKRNQQYTDADYLRLESMMYDKLTVRLQAAQFVIGDDLQSCRDALVSNDFDNLHLLERTNIDLQVQNSIVPTAYNLPRFKISGHLPSLQVNLSDTKYKALMRLIDVAIPHFDVDPDGGEVSPGVDRPGVSFRLPTGFFGPVEPELDVPEALDSSQSVAGAAEHEDEFFEADEGSQSPEIHQRVVEIHFTVDTLRASLFRSTGDNSERELGNVTLSRFALDFAMEKFVMSVDVNLGSMSMSVVQNGKEPLEFMTSIGTSTENDLLKVRYTRVQPESPDFMTVYEGSNQGVDVKVTTFIFRVAPEPLVALYDFIMTTFVPNRDVVASPAVPPPVSEVLQPAAVAQGPPEKIRVFVKLASVQVVLINNDIQLATLSMSTGDVSVLLRANTMRVNARLGSLALSDDSEVETFSPTFKQLLSIEGDNFADFQYQTYDPEDKETYKGVKSSVHLSAGALKLHFLEQPLRNIYVFLLKLAKLKGVYDAATQAAVQRAGEIERMQFEVIVKSPIIVLPTDPQRSHDVLTLCLGELTAHNAYEEIDSKITASLRGIQLSSIMYYGGEPKGIKMIDDIDINAEVLQAGGVDHNQPSDRPDTEVKVTISDVLLHLTQIQYHLLIALLNSISRAVAVPSDSLSSGIAPHESSQIHAETPAVTDNTDSSVELLPEIRTHPTNGQLIWNALDLVVTLETVKLHLYDEQATDESKFGNCGIASFALHSTSLRAKMLSNNAKEVELVLKSFTMKNTRPGNSKFREIIPAASHDRNQVMILYTTSGEDPSGLAVITVDAPQVILAIEPVICLLSFFMNPAALSDDAASQPVDESSKAQSDIVAAETSTGASINIRLDLHDVFVNILEDDTNPDSQAIRWSIQHVLISQQGVIALTVQHLGMSLLRMGKESESVRFLDDVDLTFSLDTRSSSSHHTTSIELTVQPVIFRASYRDINLITTIVNKAIQLYSQTIQAQADPASADAGTKAVVKSSRAQSSRLASTSAAVGRANVVTTKEQLKGSIGGFRLVLIGDVHEQPMLHLKVKPFIIGAKDWSGDLQATATLAVHISYWNLATSHWEPLIDPWTFSVSLARENGGIGMSVSARERLNLNVSTTFVELAIATAKLLGTEVQASSRNRGSSAPYRICNRTGSSILVWSDLDGTTATATTKEASSTQITTGKTVDWRFDDWRTMREHVSTTGNHSIGVQFIGKQWEQLRSVPVDRVGTYTFSLRPRTEKYAHRLLCEVAVQDNVKVVTLRSTYLVENKTLYPLEVTLVDASGQPVHSLEKIAPGQDYALPIDAVNQNRIRVQPDQGFGYKWSPAIRWEDLLAKRSFTIRCPHADASEAAFRFQAWVDTDSNDINARKSPRVTLKLRAPLELENLLPYNIEYRIYDKDTDQNWRSYLRKGGIMPVHSVELSHLVLLNVNVQDTAFKPSDFAIINTDGSADFDIENRLTLRDNKDRKIDLKLNYVRYPDSGGSFKVQICSPYLIVNKTGLPYEVRPMKANRMGSVQDVAGDTRPEVMSLSAPFLLSLPDQCKNLVFKVGESVWSQPVSLDAPSADTRLAIPSQTQKSEEVHVGLSWTEGLGKYKQTKVITLAPRFIVRNASRDAISFREVGSVPRGRASLNPGERAPLHFLRLGEDKLLTVAFPVLNAQWSAPINIEDIGVMHFRLKAPRENGDVRLMRADVKLGGATIFIVISQEEEGWPFTIENETDFSMWTVQMPPRPTHLFRAAREKKLVLAVNSTRRVIDIMEIGDLIPFKFADPQGTHTVSLDVRAEHHKQVLRITKYDPEFSLYKPKRRQSGSLARQDSISGSVEAFEAIQDEVAPSLSFTLDLEGIGISLVNRRMIEVVYLSLNGLKFEYANSVVAQSVNLACGSLQIDNQLHDAIFPVVLQPTPIPRNISAVASLPTVQASLIWLKDQEHGVTFIKYCSVLLQALTVEADEDFLFAVYDLTKLKGASWDEGQQDVLIQDDTDDIVEPQSTSGGADMYFEVLELQPIKLSISFMRTERVSGEDKLSIRNPIAVVLNAITMAVGNVNDAQLEMNSLAIKDMRLTLPDLQERIMYHYGQDVLRQLYRILGSADFIGNPVGLFTNVSSGVADIFYEPFNGAVMRGNKELGISIAKGAASFVKKTVFGVSDSLTRITSSVGKGLSAATFDSEYQMRRRMNQRRNKPRHAIYGVAAGAEAFASSVASGFEGVVLKPIEGAESEGAKGFFKGVGKGIVGAVTKPVIGVFDLAANVTEGIRNTTTVFDNPARDRVRMPRHVPMDGILVPYSEREALGQYWMKDLENGAYRKELYVAHINLPGGDNVVLLTSTKLLSFWSNRLRLDWELPFTQVQGVTIEDTGIRFAHKMGKEHDKFVIIPDKASQSWFFGQVASVVKAYNTRRRMDA